ncbi:hypothetical protein Poli38472_014487 [Pythium oligandrum]|uniref:Uncharacterized protein n=1 Tax=Pythium oligandrum TaxID=41045 RepID=A0A8K1CCV4_PYTOL|nr:hypothetical protein Poli38472_014487 [Pythium oligandrum]|eukprot:TMW61026.1 hypothetical protein Poli38472_014487 [Pythium oligandrum]
MGNLAGVVPLEEQNDLEMSPTKSQATTFGTRVISLCIVIVLALHVGYTVSYAYEAQRYYRQAYLDSTVINTVARSRGMELEYDRIMELTLAASSSLFGFWHCLGIFRAVLASARHRRLLLTAPETTQISKITNHLTTRIKSKSNSQGSWCAGCCTRALAPIKDTFHRIRTTWREYFTIDGTHYELGAGFREVIEITTQLHVVYRISGVAISKQLNNLAVSFFILNCFSTPLVLGRQPAYVRRLGRHIVGMIFTALINIVMINAMWWYVEVAIVDAGFWFDPIAATQLRFLSKEAYVNMWLRVVSTRGAMCLAIFALEGLKRRLSLPSDTTTSAVAVSDIPLPDPASGPTAATIENTGPTLRVQRIRVLAFIRRIPFVEVLAVSVGILVLVAHIQAGMHPPPHTPGLQCDMPLHPWAVFKWPCGVVELNCYRAGVAGQASEIDTLLEKLDPGSVSAMRLTHCSRLEMPPRIKTFSNLAMFEVYNASLVRWEADSAFTKTSHPHLGTLWLVRVQNLTQLPPGVLEPGFPATNVHVCESNLITLPSDLDKHWSVGMARFAIECSALTAIPDSLLRLAPLQVSVAGNHITTVPSVQIGLPFLPLSIADNPVTALPYTGYANIYLDLRSTQVAQVPGWMTRSSQPQVILAGGSPLCDGVEAPQTKINSITLVCVTPASKDDVLTFPLRQFDAKRAP